jgi:hypothetical protein
MFFGAMLTLTAFCGVLMTLLPTIGYYHACVLSQLCLVYELSAFCRPDSRLGLFVSLPSLLFSLFLLLSSLVLSCPLSLPSIPPSPISSLSSLFSRLIFLLQVLGWQHRNSSARVRWTGLFRGWRLVWHHSRGQRRPVRGGGLRGHTAQRRGLACSLRCVVVHLLYIGTCSVLSGEWVQEVYVHPALCCCSPSECVLWSMQCVVLKRVWFKRPAALL